MYVDSNELHPLDVLLERTTKKPSRAIAHAVSGKYSHAALVVSSLELFEATTTGVGMRIFSFDARRYPWSWYGGDAIEVLSHSLLPHLSHERQEELTSEARMVCYRLNGKKYAALADLIALGRRSWIVFLQRHFPTFLRGIAHAFQWLLGTMELFHSPFEWKWKLMETMAPSEMKGRRFYCSEAVAFVFAEIGLPFENNLFENERVVPHDLTDKERFFLNTRPIVRDGLPPKASKLDESARKAGKAGMKAASKIISARVPDNERMNAMMAGYQADQPYSKEFWTAINYIDKQKSQISALTSLQSNILDLITHRKHAMPPVPAWAATISLRLKGQANAATLEAIPDFLTTLLQVGQSYAPLKELIDEIKAHESRIVSLRAECANACAELLS